ncbi:MAG: LysR family transcriptional regulator [Proteobacteria bacterium]|nr:LysR family transcriptional regulator [Pseudomonadota bacterium]
MNPTFRQLRVFAEVARLGSMARAAESLHLTAPAISMQVKELENQVGLPLFDREGRKVALTTAGEYFAVYAQRLLATLKEAGDVMARLRHLEWGAVTVGMVSTAKYLVPPLLTRFREAHPGVELKLLVGHNREHLAGLLHQGELDLAIMGRPPRELATRAEPFGAHPHGFVATPGHPLLRLEGVPLAAVAQYPLIAREPASGTRALMDALLHEARVAPRIAMEMPSNESIKQAVMAGMGVAFLSLHTVQLERRTGLLEVVPVEGTPVMRTWNVVHMAARTLSPAAEALRYFVLEQGEAFLAGFEASSASPIAIG